MAGSTSIETISLGLVYPPNTYSRSFSIKVAELKKHKTGIESHWPAADAWCQTALASFDVGKFETWLEGEKPWFAIVERDRKDAKRRVNAMKPKTQPAETQLDNDDENSEEN